jgi:hypothetical protein
MSSFVVVVPGEDAISSFPIDQIEIIDGFLKEI